ncbi:MAG: hypothetical protein R3B41_00815 [Candidatus Doudnabacteria bacterium]
MNRNNQTGLEQPLSLINKKKFELLNFHTVGNQLVSCKTKFGSDEELVLFNYFDSSNKIEETTVKYNETRFSLCYRPRRDSVEISTDFSQLIANKEQLETAGRQIKLIVKQLTRLCLSQTEILV